MLIWSYNFDKTVFFIKFACHLPVGRQHAVIIHYGRGIVVIC